MANKAFELREAVGGQDAAKVLPLLVEHLTQSRSEEEGGAWRVPIDLIGLIKEAEDYLQEQTRSPGQPAKPLTYHYFLVSDPKVILQLTTQPLQKEVPAATIIK